MLSRNLRLIALLLIGACSPKESPPPTYSSDKAVPPNERDDEETRKLAVEKPEDPAHSDPADEDRDLGKVPRDKLTASSGEEVSLRDVTAESRGAIVVFYRGHWCKYCRVQLKELQAALHKLTGRGFTVHAISTDPVEKARELKKKLGLDFELYSDVGGLASHAWGVYSEKFDLARPSVFVVAPGGEITYRYVSDTPADRPSIETLIEVAEQARPVEGGEP